MDPEEEKRHLVARQQETEARIISEYTALEERHEADHAAAAKRFDPLRLIAKAREIQRIEDPELGTIEYTEPTLDDLLETSVKTKDMSNEEKTKYLIWRMLCKTYPDLKVEDVGLLPPKLITIFSDKIPFFSTMKKSSNGSPPMRTPR